MPDLFFCLGTLGRDILIKNGVSPEKLVLSGSPRYDHMMFDRIEKKSAKETALSILIVSTLHENLDMEMIQAVALATTNLNNIKIFLRSHPFNRLENKQSFSPYIGLITPVYGALTDNLKMVDIVVFSYSTVAEESYIRGVPIIQWGSARFNGSVFRDIQAPKVRSVVTVNELSEAIREFQNRPQDYSPSIIESTEVAERCFYRTDGLAAERIAEYIRNVMH